MKRSLLLLGALFLPLPAHAITWKEFWEPFTEPVYVYPEPPRVYRRPVDYCRVRVVREEYVPGYYINRWNYRDGYVRRWYETEFVPCDRR